MPSPSDSVPSLRLLAHWLAIAAALTAAVWSTAATAAPSTPTSTLTNNDFEVGALAEGAVRAGSPTGWSGGSAVYNPSSQHYAGLAGKTTVGSMGGVQVAVLSGAAPAPLQQTTTMTVEARRAYMLSVAIGGRSTGEPFAGAALELLVNGQVVASRRVDSVPAPGSFGDVSLAWNAPAALAGQPLSVRIRALTPTDGAYVDVDNVRLVAGFRNADFEADALADGGIRMTPPTDWSGGTGSFNPNAVWYSRLASAPTQGSMAGPHAGFLFGANAPALQQNSATTAVAGMSYTVTVAVGGRDKGDVFYGLGLDLLANGVVVASQSVTAPPAPGSFGDVALTWQAPASAQGALLGVRLRALAPNSGHYLDVDNVRLSAASGASVSAQAGALWSGGIDNGGFEAQTLAPGASSATAPDGWTGGSGVFRPDARSYPGLASAATIGSMSGGHVAGFWGTAQPPLAQTTLVPVEAGAAYTLTVAVGGRSTGRFGGLILELLANGAVVASRTVSAPPVPGSFGDVSLSWPASAAAAGAIMGVRLWPLTPGTDTYVDVDNVRLSAVGASLAVRAPVSRQVLQRSGSTADVPVRGLVSRSDSVLARLVPRAGFGGAATAWVSLAVGAGGEFAGAIPAVRAGWYDMELLASSQGVATASRTVERIGVGEVFLVAGQSNSTNYGQAPQVPGDDRVSATTLNHTGWQAAADPQPNADGTRGSPWPAFGTHFAVTRGVPVAIVSVGVGGTAVRQWQPGGTLYPRVSAAIKALGPRGFRAVLWHQGEADAYECTAAATYLGLMRNLIQATRTETGMAVPWGVATASQIPYGSPSCIQAIANAQAELVANTPGVFAGPNTNGYAAAGLAFDSVHFSVAGLTRHGQAWVDALARWGGVPPP